MTQPSSHIRFHLRRCGGKRAVLNFITDPMVIVWILDHLGLATEPPVFET